MEQDKIEFLDLRGVECPLNFVKAKLYLETMNTGGILELLIDNGEALESVPNGLSQEGYKIEIIDKISNYYRLLVVKN